MRNFRSILVVRLFLSVQFYNSRLRNVLQTLSYTLSLNDAKILLEAVRHVFELFARDFFRYCAMFSFWLRKREKVDGSTGYQTSIRNLNERNKL